MNAAEFYLEDLKSKFTKINPSDYYLAYSGGRDSHFLLWFIKEYLHENRIAMVFNNTGMDIPEIRKRGLENADYICKPTLKHAEIKEKWGIPLNSKATDYWVWQYQTRKEKGVSDDDMSNTIKHMAMRQVNATKRGRELGLLSKFAVNKKTSDAMLSGKLHKVSPWCCLFLKKDPAHQYEIKSGKKAILGIMGSESMTRKAKYQKCFSKDGRFSPLWDLTDELQKQIEDYCGIPVPSVYQYVKQTGCAGCPYGQHGKNPWKNTDIELSLCGGGSRDSFWNTSVNLTGSKIIISIK